ncbi:hypothetical protein GCM10022279_15950 [Comamonas faecalis]|uniref:Uncharacterized protein n=1 Tax=Comamonas faecalis TaxID=1387849 RepID=A0ABP7R7Z0_9BURK
MRPWKSASGWPKRGAVVHATDAAAMATTAMARRVREKVAMDFMLVVVMKWKGNGSERRVVAHVEAAARFVVRRAPALDARALRRSAALRFECLDTVISFS